MRASETVEITGHLMDSGILSRILDDIHAYGGDYVIEKFDVGHEAHDSSSARLTVEAEDDDSLQRLLMRLQTRGVNQVVPRGVVTSVAERDGVLPDGFYSTTNLPTRVHVDGAWFDVDNPEMDCGLAIDVSELGTRAFTVPMADIAAGMQVVVGTSGVQVIAPQADEPGDAFGVREADSLVERPQAVLGRQVADGMRMARADGKRLLRVAGPGVVHTGAAPAMVELIEAGFVDVLFAGNAFAASDIESSLYGNSLGIDRTMGQASSTDTSTTSGPSTRCARQARSAPRSTTDC